MAAIALVLSLAPPVQSQTASSLGQLQQVLNGLHEPTNSQQFFEEGRKQFEGETQRLQKHPKASEETILKIDESLLKQENLLPVENPSESKTRQF